MKNNKQNKSSIIEKYHETWERQQDLKTLTTPHYPRQIEVFLPNEYYGIDLIVKNFIELSPDKSLYFGIPHGVEIGDDFVGNVFGLKTNLHTHLYNNEVGLNNLIRHQVQGWNVPAAHPIALLKKMMIEESFYNQNHKINAVLFFPSHRDHTHDFVNKNYDKIVCDGLEALRQKHGEIHISFQADDILLGRHKIYIERGFKVVSSGNRMDPRFLSRFANLVTSYKYVATNEIGSHIFYSVYLGTPCIHWNLKLPLVALINTERRIKTPFLLDKTLMEYFNNGTLFSEDVANQLLGINELHLSRNYWQQIWSSSSKRDFLYFIVPNGSNNQVVLPSALRRKLKKIIGIFILFLKLPSRMK